MKHNKWKRSFYTLKIKASLYWNDRCVSKDTKAVLILWLSGALGQLSLKNITFCWGSLSPIFVPVILLRLTVERYHYHLVTKREKIDLHACARPPRLVRAHSKSWNFQSVLIFQKFWPYLEGYHPKGWTKHKKMIFKVFQSSLLTGKG